VTGLAADFIAVFVRALLLGALALPFSALFDLVAAAR